MAFITIQQLFYDAYADAGLIQLEQTGLNPDQIAECQQLYNRMIDSFQLDGLMTSHVARLTFPLVPDKGIYTVGPNGDFDPVNGISLAGPAGQIASNYPCRLERVSAVITVDPFQSGPPEYPMRALTVDDYQMWILKQQTTNWPWCFFYEPAFPLGILNLLYVPSDANYVALYIEETLAQIDATQDATVAFRPMYYDCICSNLAVRIAGRKNKQLSPDIRELARSTLSMIKQANLRPLSRTNDMTRSLRPGGNTVLSGNRYSN